MKLALPALTVILSLAGCQSGTPVQVLSLNVEEQPDTVMAAMAANALECWFASGAAAFRSYRLADETNSAAGRPRLLLVPRSDPGGLPHLVIQAEDGSSAAAGGLTRVQAFGPLLSQPAGAGIAGDIARWSTGQAGCEG